MRKGRLKKDEDIFDENVITGLVRAKKFALPDIKEGSIIEYRYTLTTKKSAALPDWNFQTELPVIRSAIKIKIPEIYNYSIRYQGNIPLIKGATENYKDISTLVGGTKTHYAINNMPGYKKEPFVGNVNNYLCKIKFCLVSYTTTFNLMGDHSTTHRFSPYNWPEVAKKLTATQTLQGAANNNVAWTFLAKEVCKNLTDSIEKVKAVYSQLNSVMKWDKLYGLAPIGTDSSGNSARINLILINMLRSVGIKADPVYISTTDHGKIDTTFPSTTTFNSLIAIADVGNQSLLLDAGNQNRPWNVLAEKDLNYLGMRVIVTQNDTAKIYNIKWIDINPIKSSATSIGATLEIDSAGNIKSKQVFTASDYEALRFRDRPVDKTMDDIIKKNLPATDGFEIISQKTDNESDPDKKLKIIFDVEKKSAGADEQIIYINPFPIKFYSENPLNEAERTYPIEFGFPVQRTISATVTIPPNYKVSEVPKAKKLALSDGSASFSLLVAQNDNNIQMSGSFHINNAVYQAEMYENLKALYAKMIDAMNSTIVLEKK